MPEEQLFETPVLLIVFRRADTTSRVLEVLRQIKPSRLYVAADGPRVDKPGEHDACMEVRRLITSVDWTCELKTLYRDNNLGCGIGPASAISWFFEQETEGIILEDDIIPDLSFFPFCKELLALYRNKENIMQICGSNFLRAWQHNPSQSYYFSHHGSIWGWASWKRAWEQYDYEVKEFERCRQNGELRDFFFYHPATYYVLDKLESAYEKDPEVNWWDYQWDFAKFLQRGLSIVPNVNLIQNIGFGAEATHTKSLEDRFANHPTYEMDFPLNHPHKMEVDTVADKKYFRQMYEGSFLQRSKHKLKGSVSQWKNIGDSFSL